MAKRAHNMYLQTSTIQHIRNAPNGSAYVDALIAATAKQFAESKRALFQAGWSKSEVKLAAQACTELAHVIPTVTDALVHAQKIGRITHGTRISPSRWREMVRQCKRDKALSFCIATVAAEIVRIPRALGR